MMRLLTAPWHRGASFFVLVCHVAVACLGCGDDASSPDADPTTVGTSQPRPLPSDELIATAVATRAKILTAGPERLDVWADRVITGRSLEEILG